MKLVGKLPDAPYPVLVQKFHGDTTRVLPEEVEIPIDHQRVAVDRAWLIKLLFAAGYTEGAIETQEDPFKRLVEGTRPLSGY